MISRSSWSLRRDGALSSPVSATTGPSGKPPSASTSWSDWFDLSATEASGDLFNAADGVAYAPPSITITCKPGDSLDHLDDGSVDAVVIDPPYEANVMYAELSDFFYVWLKRTAGHVFPELFRRQLTDKETEAVANAARFRDHRGAAALAVRDYQAKRWARSSRSAAAS